jgi:hypothetical protein
LDKDHIAAAIEKFIEGIKAEQQVYEMRADDCRREAQEWASTREAAVNGDYDEQQLREIYRRVTKVIIMGDK